MVVALNWIRLNRGIEMCVSVCIHTETVIHGNPLLLNRQLENAHQIMLAVHFMQI